MVDTSVLSKRFRALAIPLGLALVGVIGIFVELSLSRLTERTAELDRWREATEPLAEASSSTAAVEVSADPRDAERVRIAVQSIQAAAVGDSDRLKRAARISALAEPLIHPQAGPELQEAGKRLRKELREAIQAELVRLAAGAERTRGEVSRTRWIVALGGLASFGVIAIAAALIRREVRSRSRRYRELVENLNLLRAITEETQDAVWVKDAARRYKVMNEAGARMIGRPAGEIIGRTDAELFPAAEAEAMERSDAEVLASGRTTSCENVGTAGGSRRVYQSTKGVYRDLDGTVVGIVGISRDITERLDRESTIASMHEEASRQAARRIDDISTIGSMVGLLQSCATFEEASPVVASALARVLPDTNGFVAVFKASRNVLEPVATWGRGVPSPFEPGECWALRRGRPHRSGDGGTFPSCVHVREAGGCNGMCVPMMAQGETLGVLHVSLPGEPEIASRLEPVVGGAAESLALALANLRLRETLRNQSVRDPMTGLYNRRFLEESLRREVARAKRRSTPFALLVADLDHFKYFNDTFGHDAGDLVLSRVASVLASGVRSDDVVCRYGGEEFVLLLPESGLDDAARRADTLRARVGALELSHAGRDLGRVTLSIGVAAFPQHGVDPVAVLKCADEALYEAKRAGRDRVVKAPVATGRLAPTG